MIRETWDFFQTELFGQHCAFCGRGLLAGQSRKDLCPACALQAWALHGVVPHLQVLGGLQVHSLAPYAGWLKDAILLNKRNPHPLFIQWTGALLAATLARFNGNATPVLYWVPSSAFEAPHLVEALARELCKSTCLPPNRLPVSEKLWGAGKLRFTHSREERAEVVRRKFSVIATKTPTQAVPAWVLMDDVCTTGNTLCHIHSAISQKTHSKALFALTLAFTP